MKNIRILQYNGYATNETGKNFRAISIGGKWRLALEVEPDYQWNFVNDIKYDTCIQALADCDLY